MTRFLNKLLERRWLKYAVIAILPTLALLSAPIVNYTVLIFGQRALLETIPVDPTDFLRGDYVTLDYKISDITSFVRQEGESWDYDRRGRQAFVSLALDRDGVASVSAISEERPSGLYLIGKAGRSWADSFTCDYGLGVYYVPEGTGKEIEYAIRDGDTKVFADVRIIRGRGVIKKLEIAVQ
jgi:uncharacterized membrane-anchored protein